MHSTHTSLDQIDISGLIQTAYRAGRAIMDVYNQPFEIIEKSDGSLLTLADKNANNIINAHLRSTYHIPILSEENDAIPFEIRKNWNQLWIVDPLDGTKEFIHKRREFTVNIALVENGRPILGVIYAPVFDEMFYAVRGQGGFFCYHGQTIRLHSSSSLEFKNKIFSNPGEKHLKIILSRSHNDGFELEKYLALNQSIQTIAMGSSLKFCRIAQGLVDANIRVVPTSEWDTAAAQIILEEAGRKLVNFEDGTPLVYNKEQILNPFFVAY